MRKKLKVETSDMRFYRILSGTYLSICPPIRYYTLTLSTFNEDTGSFPRKGNKKYNENG